MSRRLLSAPFDWRRINGGNADLSVFASNITDEEYRTSNTGVFQAIGLQGALFGGPRMVGARLRYNWGG